MTFNEITKRLDVLRKTDRQEIGCRVGEMIKLLEELWALKAVLLDAEYKDLPGTLKAEARATT